jgi:hypothetical protein
MIFKRIFEKMQNFIYEGAGNENNKPDKQKNGGIPGSPEIPPLRGGCRKARETFRTAGSLICIRPAAPKTAERVFFS